MPKQLLEKLLQDSSQFDQSKDGKIPLKRTPSALVIRFLMLFSKILFSRHPQDAVIWLRSLYSRRHPLSYIVPWITFDAARELETRLNSDSNIFEYGSGHSTVYWANKGFSITSVEDNRDWFQVVSNVLKNKSKARILFEKDPHKYVNSIYYSGDKFNVIVIDGSHRKDCIKVALEALVPGGLLVVDNTDWHWFQNKNNLVPGTWKKYVFPGAAPFIGHLSETTFWIKPIGLE